MKFLIGRGGHESDILCGLNLAVINWAEKEALLAIDTGSCSRLEGEIFTDGEEVQFDYLFVYKQ